MEKELTTISIKKTYRDRLKKAAKRDRRNISVMLEIILDWYFNTIKKI